jgi:spoIIIJ-associated protein
MSEPKTSLEIIAPSVEEAIARGAAELGIPEERLEVEILDEGTKGFLGLGTRQARIRLSIRQPQEDAEELAQVEEPGADLEPLREQAVQEREDQKAEGREDADVLLLARETVSELLERMSVEAEIKAYWGEKSETSNIQPLHVDIHGKDLSILIGRRGETLSALQYITRLILGKELRRPVAVVIDVEGYRARKERQLRQLARRIAKQAIERGRTMSLEPMPANERRIIHIELRDDPEVYTESVGEGDRRKVTIKLRRE